MLYTADGLEQASRLEVAATHAGRYYNASLATVHDLGCGIGSDAVAMSALGVTVQGVDIDPVTAAIADINLRPWPGLPGPGRAGGGVRAAARTPARPRRRVAGPGPPVPGMTGRHGRIKRVFRLDEIRPTWEFVLQVATRGAGDRREAVALDAARRHPARHRGAVDLVRRRGARVRRVVGAAHRAAGPQRPHPGPDRSPIEVDLAMAEPDPRRRRARCGRAVALRARPGGDAGGAPRRGDRRTLGSEVDRGLGYVVSETEVDVPVRAAVCRARGDAVQHSVAAGLAARSTGSTGLTIKKRGVRLDDDELRRQLRIGRKAGDGAQATVILTRVAGEQVVLVVDPA